MRRINAALASISHLVLSIRSLFAPGAELERGCARWRQKTVTFLWPNRLHPRSRTNSRPIQTAFRSPRDMINPPLPAMPTPETEGGRPHDGRVGNARSAGLHRRHVLAGLGALALPAALGGCVTPAPRVAVAPPMPDFDPSYVAMYGPIDSEPYPVPAIDLAQIDPAFLRRVVSYEGSEPAGSIVIDPSQRYLYLVRGDGSAVRYGVGVGREGFGWSGRAEIRRKAEWPRWVPPKEMIRRQPDIRSQLEELDGGALGMDGGLDNPLGARAMYLYQGDRDTLYRIHGTNEPQTIGTRVSSGCIRMINQDVIDLYRRVPVGTRVHVLSFGGAVG
jgi:lipoprotein-anchoring transpeptidase ErfK/SrfK